MKEKSELKIGLIVTITGVFATATLGWAGWVSITLYAQNGTLTSLNAKTDDNNTSIHEVLNLLSGKDIIPLPQSTAMAN